MIYEVFSFFKTRKFLLFLWLVSSLSILSADVFAQSIYRNMHLRPNANGVYEISIYKSGIIVLDKPARQISVGNPGIADILILRSKELYIVGKALGSTNITVWDNKHHIIASFDATVTHDLNNLKLQLYELMPEESIEVRSAQERIILSGEVSNIVKMKAAMNLAESYLPDCIAPNSNITMTDSSKGVPIILQQGNQSRRSGNQECKEGRVVNLMQIGGAQQVMLEVKIAEVSRLLMRKLDSKFRYFNFGSNFGGIVNGGDGLIPADGGGDGLLPIIGGDLIGDKSIFFSRLGSDYLIQAVIEASKANGLAKILAEPTLVTLTGEQAKFLSGGEFPIPVPGEDGQVTIEYKDYGVGLMFLPVVLNSGNINMKLNVDVSELSTGNSVSIDVASTDSTFFIPALTKRSASSTVELADGQTIGIAGLISDNTRAFVDKLPGMGEIPVFGALFSSQEYLTGQTELVIFVTPHLAKPIAPEKIKLPTDAYVPPNDMEFYLLGRLQGRYETNDASPQSYSAPITNEAGGFDGGFFGHDL